MANLFLEINLHVFLSRFLSQIHFRLTALFPSEIHDCCFFSEPKKRGSFRITTTPYVCLHHRIDSVWCRCLFYIFEIPSTFSCTLWWNLPALSKAIQKRSPSAVVIVLAGGSKIDLHSSPVDTLCYSFLDDDHDSFDDHDPRLNGREKKKKKKKKKEDGEAGKHILNAIHKSCQYGSFSMVASL